DPLYGPLGPQLGAGHAPHLLRVCLEEDAEEPAAEAVSHPLLERQLARVGQDLPAQVAGEDEHRLPEPQLAQRVRESQRVREEPPIVVDARQPRPAKELCAEELLPHREHASRLGEEAMPAEVETESAVGLRAGQTADARPLLDHDRPSSAFHQLVRGCEPGRARPDHDELVIRARRTHRARTATWRLSHAYTKPTPPHTQ